jgi:hypothetical protein
MKRLDTVIAVLGIVALLFAMWSMSIVGSYSLN